MFRRKPLHLGIMLRHQDQQIRSLLLSNTNRYFSSSRERRASTGDTLHNNNISNKTSESLYSSSVYHHDQLGEVEPVDILDIMNAHGREAAAATAPGVQTGHCGEQIVLKKHFEAASESRSAPTPKYLRGATAMTATFRKFEGMINLDATEKHKFLSAFLGGDILAPPAAISATTATSTVGSASTVVSTSTGQNTFSIAGTRLRTTGTFKSFAATIAARASLVVARDSVHIRPENLQDADQDHTQRSATSYFTSLTWPSQTLSASATSASALISGSSNTSAITSDDAVVSALLKKSKRLVKDAMDHGSDERSSFDASKNLKKGGDGAKNGIVRVLSATQRSKELEKVLAYAKYEISIGEAITKLAAVVTEPASADPKSADNSSTNKTSLAKRRLANKLGLTDDDNPTTLINTSTGSATEEKRKNLIQQSRAHLLAHFTTQHQRFRKLIFHDLLPLLILDVLMRAPGALTGSRSEHDSTAAEVEGVTYLQRTRQDLEFVFKSVERKISDLAMGEDNNTQEVSNLHQQFSDLWLSALAACRVQADALLLNASVSHAAMSLTSLAATACGGVPQNSASSWWQDGGVTEAHKRILYTVAVAEDYARDFLVGFSDPILAVNLNKGAELERTSCSSSSHSSSSHHPVLSSGVCTLAPHASLLPLALAARMEINRAKLRLGAMTAAIPSLAYHSRPRGNEHDKTHVLKEMLLVAEAVASGAFIVDDKSSEVGQSQFIPLESLLPTPGDVMQFCASERADASRVLQTLAFRDHAAGVLQALEKRTNSTHEDCQRDGEAADLTSVRTFIRKELQEVVICLGSSKTPLIRAKVDLASEDKALLRQSSPKASYPTIMSLLQHRIYRYPKGTNANNNNHGDSPLAAALVAFELRALPSSPLSPDVAASNNGDPPPPPLSNHFASQYTCSPNASTTSFKAGWPLSFLVYLFQRAHGNLNAVRELHEVLVAVVGGAFRGVGQIGGSDVKPSPKHPLDPALTPEALACVTYAFLSALASCGPMGNYNTVLQKDTSNPHNPIDTPSHNTTSLALTATPSSSFSHLKPSELIQWAKDAYDDYVSWVPQTHWRNTLVLYGLLQCVSSAQDNWKAQVMFQQIVMQARIGKGQTEAAGAALPSAGSAMGAVKRTVSTGGEGAIAGLGMARTRGKGGRSRRSRPEGDGFGENTKTGGQQLGTEMERSTFDAAARKQRQLLTTSMPSLGVRRRGKRRGGMSLYNELGMTIAGVVAPALLDRYLLSFRDPFQAFYAMESQFLFNLRPSTDTVHSLMVRLLLDHLAVREDNTIVTTPNPQFVRQQLRLLETGGQQKDGKVLVAKVEEARRVPLFSTLADQRKAILELERAEEAEALQLLIDSVDNTLSTTKGSHGAPNGKTASSTSSLVDEQTTRHHERNSSALATRPRLLLGRRGLDHQQNSGGKALMLYH